MFGGSSDLWGETWSPTDFNNTNFELRYETGGITSADFLQVKVYYTELEISLTGVESLTGVQSISI
jgi:hypothetical protein